MINLNEITCDALKGGAMLRADLHALLSRIGNPKLSPSEKKEIARRAEELLGFVESLMQGVYFIQLQEGLRDDLEGQTTEELEGRLKVPRIPIVEKTLVREILTKRKSRIFFDIR